MEPLFRPGQRLLPPNHLRIADGKLTNLTDFGKEFHFLNIFSQPSVAIGLRAEQRPRLAPHCIAAPAQVAKRDLFVRIGDGEQRFQITELLHPLDERATDKSHAITVP
jgi:hypothetical protein